MSANTRQVGGTHYKDMGIQPWDVMQTVMTHEEFVGFLKGNYLKYAMRAGKKGEASEDVQKALHYKQKLDEVLGYHYYGFSTPPRDIPPSSAEVFSADEEENMRIAEQQRKASNRLNPQTVVSFGTKRDDNLPLGSGK